MNIISRCYKCGRTLRTEPWVEMGIGRICAGRMGIEPPTEAGEREVKMQNPKLPRRKMGNKKAAPLGNVTAANGKLAAKATFRHILAEWHGWRKH